MLGFAGLFAWFVKAGVPGMAWFITLFFAAIIALSFVPAAAGAVAILALVAGSAAFWLGSLKTGVSSVSCGMWQEAQPISPKTCRPRVMRLTCALVSDNRCRSPMSP